MVTSNERDKSVVYVLGAGATKAIIPNAPLMAQLLPETLRMFEQGQHYSSGHWGEMVCRIKNFIADFYQFNSAILPNLDDILTQLDDAIIEGRPLSRQYNVAALRQIREDLVFAICEVLRQTLDFSAIRNGEIMRSFMSKLGHNDSILSLNYDIVVDNTLFRHLGSVDYGFSVRYALGSEDWRERYKPHHRSPPLYKRLSYTIQGEHWRQAYQPHYISPPLYKLHGSLNWVYCPSCQQLDVTIGMKGVRYIYEEGHDFACPDCCGQYDPLIITPTLLKTYDNILLREVWRQAEDKISRADEVVFIGYSLPDADVQLRCMFSRALYKNRVRLHDTQGGNSSCKIRVVGNSPPNNETHKRYIRLFGMVEYHANGFQDYIERLDR